MKITIETITGVVDHVVASYDSQLTVIALFFCALWVITLLLTLMKNDYMVELENKVKRLNGRLKLLSPTTKIKKESKNGKYTIKRNL